MLSVLFGIGSIVIGILWVVMWGAWNEFVVVLQGGLPPFLILVGLVAVAAGFSSMKDGMASKKEEKDIEAAPAAPVSQTGEAVQAAQAAQAAQQAAAVTEEEIEDELE